LIASRRVIIGLLSIPGAGGLLEDRNR